jgi:DNA polymerase-3 subunit delta
MNTGYFEGKDISPGEIIDLAETLPFFADRRVIVIENSGWFQKGGEEMASYLDSMPETTFFIFVEPQVDKRSRLYKAVTKKGRAVEFAPQNEDTLKRWVMGMLKKEGKTMTMADLQYFLDRTGTQMELIRTEAEKLFCYTLDKDVITREDIDAVCQKRVQNQIFDMINAISAKEQKKALQHYYDLLTLKEPPMRILALMGRQFNLLLQVKELKQKGYSPKTIAEKTKLHSFIVGKVEKQAAGFKTEELRQALEDCVKADERVKTGQISDRLSVELLIVQYSC